MILAYAYDHTILSLREKLDLYSNRMIARMTAVPCIVLYRYDCEDDCSSLYSIVPAPARAARRTLLCCACCGRRAKKCLSTPYLTLLRRRAKQCQSSLSLSLGRVASMTVMSSQIAELKPLL